MQLKYYTYVHEQNNKGDEHKEDIYNITLPESRSIVYPIDDADVIDSTINTTTTNESNNEDSATTSNNNFPRLVKPIIFGKL